jgi:hypothetical protein
MSFPDDAKMPSEAEQRHLSRLMYHAFCELRLLAFEGRNEQAHALADAFHNVPLMMYRDGFSHKVFRLFLEGYQKRYEDKLGFDYLKEWEKLNSNSTAI